jgi:hypothetical protein
VGKVTLVAQDSGEVVEAPSGVWMVGAHAGLVDGEGTLVKGASGGKVTLVAQDVSKPLRLRAMSGWLAPGRAS